jgi:integrase
LDGKPYRKTLKTRSFERAQQTVNKIEEGKQPERPKAVTIKDALTAFIKDCESRNLNASTLRKYRRLSARLTAFATARNLHKCDDFTVDLTRDFRSSWKLSPRTASKELERLRAFFKFCVEADWAKKNYAKSLKGAKVKISPRLPFSEKEIQAILSKAQDDRELGFLLTLRHTGLRIGDASLLKVSQVSDSRVYLYTTKAGTPVSILIPETLASLLKKLPLRGGYFFLRGDSTSMHTTADLWRRRIKLLCKAAGITPDHPHRFRHSLAADLLSRGVSTEHVAAILGNSPAIVARHYSQWIASRQDALDAALQSTWKPQLAIVKSNAPSS